MQEGMLIMAEKAKVLEPVIVSDVVDMMKIGANRMDGASGQPPNDMGTKRISKRIGARVVGSVDPEPTAIVEIALIPPRHRPRLALPNEAPINPSNLRQSSHEYTVPVVAL